MLEWARDILRAACASEEVPLQMAYEWVPPHVLRSDMTPEEQKVLGIVSSLRSFLWDWPGELGNNFVRLTDESYYQQLTTLFADYMVEVEAFRAAQSTRGQRNLPLAS